MEQKTLESEVCVKEKLILKVDFIVIKQRQLVAQTLIRKGAEYG